MSDRTKTLLLWVAAISSVTWTMWTWFRHVLSWS